MCTDLNDHARPEEMAALLGRRGFLRTAAVGAAVAGGAAASIAAPALAAESPAAALRRRVPMDRISIQLYTVRDALTADPAGTLATLREIGYRRVETAGTAGLTTAEFRQLLDDNGIRATSAHIGIPQPFDAAAWRQSLADAITLGCRRIVHPFFGFDANGPIRSAQVYRAFARDLNRAGAMARRAGLRLGYHNHHAEFLPLDDGSGRNGYDVLTAVTNPRLVHLELDLYWAWRGAADPVDVMRAHRGRVRQFHVKDMNIDSGFTDPGTGLIDFRRIFARPESDRVRDFIVERDDAGTDPRQPADALDTARVGYEFLRDVRF